ncbi:Alpha-ketoglutarate-dependent sulfonate dioxygenase [Penicillium manginii]|uniref:Alpha-ketoglutarate-dependent sulfonate dioxygenase n=1 Tax=Penicillium manginii TaxID=203109 RepID=UPI00254915D4|nr:Alpha-ketoglutarate-dependent sulfonate dioxygenase [Penicillium manginii]KAJ5743622.1 Alpha-ketoglutarate-dependent sulfonate dioxygenase [Penicillium manginii]
MMSPSSVFRTPVLVLVNDDAALSPPENGTHRDLQHSQSIIKCPPRPPSSVPTKQTHTNPKSQSATTSTSPTLTSKKQSKIKTPYPQYLPTWDPIWFDPLPPFEYNDPALRACKHKPNLLPPSNPSIKITHIQPNIGTTIEGLQLNTLTDAAKDELALLISERKVLAFPDQNLIDDGPDAQESFMRYFGKPNYQPVSGSIRNHPAFHVIHRDGNRDEIARFLEARTTTTLWHQDGPEVGGDTVFSATDMAYKRLSPTLRSFLDTLKAVHSSAKMIHHTRLTGGLVRKDPVDSVHPLVRVHPVTGEKCLFLNQEFITKIPGLKEPETKWMLDFLMNHIITGHDFQARVRWQPRTIVMFDNRSTTHSAIVDYLDDEYGAKARHIFRLAALGEKPIPVYDEFDE